jgi:hypothetical protein
MDAAIDLSDAKTALDLSNIRFQLMYPSPTTVSLYVLTGNLQTVD